MVPVERYMRVENGSRKPQPNGRVRVLIVVAQDQPELWQALTRDFPGNGDLQVLLDRRRGEWRLGDRTNEVERRRPPSIETDVRSRQYVITRAQQVPRV